MSRTFNHSQLECCLKIEVMSHRKLPKVRNNPYTLSPGSTGHLLLEVTSSFSLLRIRETGYLFEVVNGASPYMVKSIRPVLHTRLLWSKCRLRRVMRALCFHPLPLILSTILCFHCHRRRYFCYVHKVYRLDPQVFAHQGCDRYCSSTSSSFCTRLLLALFFPL